VSWPARASSDALVVGGNLAGLFVAHTLAGWGFRTRLVERSTELGGMDRSFALASGAVFDFGVHALAHRRSELVTRLFRDVLDDRVRRVDVRRALALRGHLIPYHAPPEAWPEELRALLRQGEIVDDLQDAPPTRENLGRIYGAGFADLIFDEVLPSYPAEHRHARFGVPESRLLTNVYPWFFPRARRERPAARLSGSFQERVRRGELPEQVLYPLEGGFGAFPAALRRRAEARGVDVVAGASDLAIDVEPGSARVRSITACGRSLRAERVYWCASPTELQRVLGLPTPDVRPDRFVLLSLELAREVEAPWTEILVGEPEHRIDRISFRGRLAGIDNRLVQLEYAYPARGPGSVPEGSAAKPSFWLQGAMRSLRSLGLLEPGNEVRDHDLKRVPILYNAFGVEGVAMPEPRFDLPPGSNLRPVLPTLKKVNINTRFLRLLTEDLG